MGEAQSAARSPAPTVAEDDDLLGLALELRLDEAEEVLLLRVGPVGGWWLGSEGQSAPRSTRA